ncbi:DUF1904 domain-containing protein [Brassicibacter mesophilus]|uniref:DUF1904 domain-containing protein n=1 Tax=Brassicibacter mesophilus TaxID=745119 RepID=UPI003D1F330F
MPQLKFRGVKVEDICTISISLVDQLENILKCPREYFTLEHIPSTFINEGKISNGYPFIEVAWFDRGQEIQDKVAEIITEELKNAGYSACDIFFTLFKESSYYENGKHF